MANHAYNGIEPRRYAAGSTLAAGARPCLDGWVNIAAGGNRRLPAFLRMIGRPELADDPRLKVPAQLVDRALVDDIEATYMGWLMQRTKADAVARRRSRRTAAGDQHPAGPRRGPPLPRARCLGDHRPPAHRPRRVPRAPLHHGRHTAAARAARAAAR
jgi:crotonobetainyl-CoA:carnitine CoA-transferase CaiB-like acyl-CoA transferase